MSIKKLSRKRASQPSNLTIRMAEDRMASERMGSDKGPGSMGGRIQGQSHPPAGQNNLQQRTEDVDQKDSSEKK
jgi:hypothetical protein